jgi:Holliday junction resolvase RusA-like endonuclease
VKTQFSFRLEGPPVSKARPRVTLRGTYTPAKTRTGEKALKLVAQSRRPADWPMDERYMLTIIVGVDNNRRADCDNFAKLILDALIGVAYRDDSQVDVLWIQRKRGVEPFTSAIVEVM